MFFGIGLRAGNGARATGTPILSRQPHPLAYRSQAHAEDRCRRGLRYSAMHRIYHQLSQVRLRGSIQLPGISSRFYAHTTHYDLFGAHVSKSIGTHIWQLLEASSKTPEGAVYFLGKLLTLDI
jgi:hypothetical protein